MYMNNNTGLNTHSDLTGRSWQSHDGSVWRVTGAPAPGGRNHVRCADGREAFLSPSYIADALSRGEITEVTDLAVQAERHAYMSAF
jgi:hypothetical protein